METNPTLSTAVLYRGSSYQALPRSHTQARGVKRRRMRSQSAREELDPLADDGLGAGGSV